MASKKILILAVAFAVILGIVFDIDAAKDLASGHNSDQVEDGKFFHDYDGYYNGGDGGFDHDGGYDGERGGYDHDGGYDGHYGGYDVGHGGYYGGHGGDYCRYGCCGSRDHFHGGCWCCRTFAEATAYNQAQEARTHN